MDRMNDVSRERNSEYDPTRLQAVFERNFTYASAVERNVHRFANKTALSDPETGRSWTYAELGAVTGHLVGGLARHGVEAGDVVCYQLMNRPEFAFLYVATQGLRAVGSPMNFRLAPGETAHILDDAKPVVFVYEAAASADVATALALASHRPAVLVSVGEAAADTEPLPDSITFEELLDASAPSFRAPEAGTVWDETTRLYTSGTTGRPKAVPLSSLNETLSAHDVIMHLPLSPRDRTLNMSPWFHRGGVYCAGPNPVFYASGRKPSPCGSSTRCLSST